MLVDINLNEVKRPYRDATGTRHPADIETKWTAGALALLGWYRVNEDPRPPNARRSQSRLVWRKGDVWREWPAGVRLAKTAKGKPDNEKPDS